MRVKRLFALVRNIPTKPQTVHRWGDTPMPWPEVVVIDACVSPDEGVMAYRYRRDGTFCGDTWHPTIDAARAQARFEYGDQIGEWVEIPENVQSAIEFALTQIPGSSLARSETGP
jgi:hypothetical protein